MRNERMIRTRGARLAAGGALALGVQPVSVADLDWSHVPLIALLVPIIGLVLGCVLLLRSRLKEREEAETSRERHARQVDELVHQHELRIREAMERGAVRERDRADSDIKDRLNTVLQTIREGFNHLEEKLDAVDDHEREREEGIRLRLDEAMMDLRRAGRSTVRIMLERFGLPSVLEDLRWAVEAPGTVRVALQLQGIGRSLDRRDQIGIYHLVHDAVDTALGHVGVSHLNIRLERGTEGCMLSVESDGGERMSGHQASDAGRRRLEERVAGMKGSLSSGARPQGGQAVHVDIPLAS